MWLNMLKESDVMNLSINNIRALCPGFHSRDVMAGITPDFPFLGIGLFYCQMPVQLVPILSIPQWSIEGLSRKSKTPDRVNRTTTAKPIKKSYKQHLLKPCSFDGIGGFCLTPKEASWAEWPPETRRFIKRWCFL